MPLPLPQPGLVIGYSYLWQQENQTGRTEGLKDRPCAIIASVKDKEGEYIVTVLPITHTPPKNYSEVMEIPLKTKQRLGLDSERSWIICSEVNKFSWPGPDLRPVSKKKSKAFAYGFLPPTLYAAAKEKVLYLARKRSLKIVRRS